MLIAGSAAQLHIFGISLDPLLLHYGYLAVFAVLFLENIGLPVPGETMLLAASIEAAAGRLDIVAVALVAVASSVAGSTVGYAIGGYGGRPLVERFGKYVLITAHRLERTEDWFARRGWLVVLLGRFVDGLRQAAGIIAGISEMTFRRFLVFTAAGAVVWVAVWCTVGELAGDHIAAVSRYSGWVAGGFAAVAVIAVARVVVRSRRSD